MLDYIPFIFLTKSIFTELKLNNFSLLLNGRSGTPSDFAMVVVAGLIF